MCFLSLGISLIPGTLLDGITQKLLTLTVSPENTVSLEAELADLSLMISDSGIYDAGYSLNAQDLSQSASCIVQPMLPTNVEVGTSIAAVSGLWIVNENDRPSVYHRWQVDRNNTGQFMDLTGVHTLDLTFSLEDVGKSFRLVETLALENETLEAVSNTITI